MDDGLDGRGPATAMRGWFTALALGVIVAGFFASLYIILGFPPHVRAAGQLGAPAAASASSHSQLANPRPDAPKLAGDSSSPAAPPAQAPRRAPAQIAALPPAASPADAQPDVVQPDTSKLDLDAALDELRQSRESLQRADDVRRRTLIASTLFLGVFALIAILVLIQVYLQVRTWNRRSQKSLADVEAIAAELRPLQEAQNEIRQALPRWLQEVGEQPLGFQEEGTQFSPKALTVLDEVDHLAYIGDARMTFGQFSTQSEAAVYLNGLLLSAVAHLARSDPWPAFARLERFFDLLSRHPDAVERHRIAQAYSYRALTAYQVLDKQDAEPSWLRKSERAQIESIAKQAFADLAEASRLDPEWRHTTFVEALLCSRFYVPDAPLESSSRGELFVRGLRRAISLYKGLIEERSYRGPSRHNLARCLKRVAELTGEKSDFSDFGYTLSSFPTDEELADEALASRQPSSQDRFLWQWMLGDSDLFRSVERLNLAEYRSFWIRLLDNKVHLRNWRADLTELEQRDPIMREWSVQLLHLEVPISLANAISRRQERFDTPSSGT